LPGQQYVDESFASPGCRSIAPAGRMRISQSLIASMTADGSTPRNRAIASTPDPCWFRSSTIQSRVAGVMPPRSSSR
jgi:hypothetical protein